MNDEERAEILRWQASASRSMTAEEIAKVQSDQVGAAQNRLIEKIHDPNAMNNFWGFAVHKLEEDQQQARQEQSFWKRIWGRICGR